MKYTKNLRLPIFDNPSEDKFNISNWNEGNENIDEAYGGLKEWSDNLPLVSADAEIIDARCGEKTLGDKIRIMSTKLENMFSDIYVDKKVLELEDASEYIQSIIDNNTMVNIILPNGIINISTLKVKSYINIIGSGSTILKQTKTTTQTNLIYGTDVVQLFGLKNLILDGNKKNQTTQNDCINFKLNKDAYTYMQNSKFNDPDPLLHFENIHIYDFKNNGIYISSRGENKFNNIKINRCDGYGIYYQSYDNSFNCVNVGNCGLNGFHLSTSANTRFVNCKSFMNGTSKNVNQGYGFYIATDTERLMFSSCEAQDNFNHGFGITGNYNTLSNCYSDTNGWIYDYTKPTLLDNVSGFMIKNCVGNILEGISIDRKPHGTNGVQSYGLLIDGVANNNYIKVISYDNKVCGVKQLGSNTLNNKVEAKHIVNGKIVYEDYTLENESIYSEPNQYTSGYYKIATFRHTSKGGVDISFNFDYTTVTGTKGSIYLNSKQSLDLGNLSTLRLTNKIMSEKYVNNDMFFTSSYIDTQNNNTIIELYFKGNRYERLNIDFKMNKVLSNNYKISIDCLWEETPVLYNVYNSTVLSQCSNTGQSQPTHNSNFIGEIYVDSKLFKVYCSVKTGQGANDWVLLN